MLWSRSAVAVALLLLGACGFEPMYARTSDGSVADELGTILVLPIKDRLGQKLHNMLLDRLNPRGRPAHPRYQLSVTAEVTEKSLGLKFSDTATRAEITLSAQFALTDLATGKRVLRDSTRSVNSFNLIDSEFATLSARTNALDRAVREVSDSIKTRLGLYFAGRRRQ